MSELIIFDDLTATKVIEYLSATISTPQKDLIFDFNENVVYNINTKVFYNNNFYKSKSWNNINHTPIGDISDAYWLLLEDSVINAQKYTPVSLVSQMLANQRDTPITWYAQFYKRYETFKGSNREERFLQITSLIIGTMCIKYLDSTFGLGKFYNEFNIKPVSQESDGKRSATYAKADVLDLNILLQEYKQSDIGKLLLNNMTFIIQSMPIFVS